MLVTMNSRSEVVEGLAIPSPRSSYIRHFLPTETLFSSADLCLINAMVDDLQRANQFLPFKGASRYEVALIRTDPGEYQSELDEAFRALTCSPAAIEWFQEVSQISKLSIHTLQVNRMNFGDYSVMHNHMQNNQELNAVMMLEPCEIGGAFCVAPSLQTPIGNSHKYYLNRGEIVTFSPTTPHGVEQVESGQRITLVWGFAK